MAIFVAGHIFRRHKRTGTENSVHLSNIYSHATGHISLWNKIGLPQPLLMRYSLWSNKNPLCQNIKEKMEKIIDKQEDVVILGGIKGHNWINGVQHRSCSDKHMLKLQKPLGHNTKRRRVLSKPKCWSDATDSTSFTSFFLHRPFLPSVESKLWTNQCHGPSNLKKGVKGNLKN